MVRWSPILATTGLTRADEKLTFHDTMSDSVRAAGLRGFDVLVRSLGGDPVAMLRGQRLAADLLSNGGNAAAGAQAGQAVGGHRTRARCPDFGLRLAQAQDIGILGPVAVAIQNSRTLGEAFKIASRYLFVHNQGLSITLVRTGAPAPGWPNCATKC